MFPFLLYVKYLLCQNFQFLKKKFAKIESEYLFSMYQIKILSKTIDQDRYFSDHKWFRNKN